MCIKTSSTSSRLYLKVALVLLFTNLPISCNLFCNDSCCGEDFENTFFSIEDLTIRFGDYPGYGDELLSENTKDTLIIDSMAFALAITDLEYLVAATNSHHQQPFTFNISPVAYACSPAPPRSAQKITDITITSNQPISFSGQSIATGESLNEYFRVLENYPGSTIEEFLIDRGDFSSDFDELIFIFSTKPDMIIDQSFTFEVSLDDGQFYSLDTGRIIIAGTNE